MIMKKLFISEWQKLWRRKVTWILFITTVLNLIYFIKFSIKNNIGITPDNLKYISALNFPSNLLKNQIVSIFDIMVIIFIVMAVTNEYRTGQLRMVMTRNICFDEIFKAKYLVIVSTMFLFLTVNFLLSTFLGYLALPHENVKFPYCLRTFTISESISYNIKYYIVTGIVLVAFISVIMYISLISKTTIEAITLSLIFMFISVMLPELSLIFTSKGSNIYEILNFSCLTRIQYLGIDHLLSESQKGIGIMITSIAFHGIVFYLIGLSSFNDRDYYI